MAKVIAVIGSRSFTESKLLYDTLDGLKDKHGPFTIVSGGAIGADSIARRYAIERGIQIEELKPDWSLGKHAGLMRNTDIISKADFVVAFWDGQSKGTKDSITKAKMAKKQMIVINY